MSRVQSSKRDKSASSRSDLHEARPLLQAILLGMVLASALIAAAAMANPSNRDSHEGTANSPVETSHPF